MCTFRTFSSTKIEAKNNPNGVLNLQKECNKTTNRQHSKPEESTSKITYPITFQCGCTVLFTLTEAVTAFALVENVRSEFPTLCSGAHFSSWLCFCVLLIPVWDLLTGKNLFFSNTHNVEKKPLLICLSKRMIYQNQNIVILIKAFLYISFFSHFVD
jgi:hypothetical protein